MIDGEETARGWLNETAQVKENLETEVRLIAGVDHAPQTWQELFDAPSPGPLPGYEQPPVGLCINLEKQRVPIPTAHPVTPSGFCPACGWGPKNPYDDCGRCRSYVFCPPSLDEITHAKRMIELKEENDALRFNSKLREDARGQRQEFLTKKFEEMQKPMAAPGLTVSNGMSARRLKKRTGWQCPKCSRVYNPAIAGCIVCNDQ